MRSAYRFLFLRDLKHRAHNLNIIGTDIYAIMLHCTFTLKYDHESSLTIRYSNNYAEICIKSQKKETCKKFDITLF